MPEEFECRQCGGTEFWTHIDDTVRAITDGYGDVLDYGDIEDSDNTWNSAYTCIECGAIYGSMPAESPESEWIAAKERFYLGTKGISCPICLSHDIEGSSFEADASSAWQSCSCAACGSEWNDVYHLREVDIISYPTDLVPEEVKTPPEPEQGALNPNEAFKNNENNTDN